MFGEWSYPGHLGDLGGGAFQAAVGAGFTGTKQQWKQAGKQTPPGYVAPTPPPVSTIPTTEPNQCPPGMTYSAPPPGSGTGTCTGSIVPTDGNPALGAPGSTDGSGGSITDLL